MRIWEDLSLCDYQQITLMCNDTKVIDQRESGFTPNLLPTGGPIQHLRPILSTDSTILKYHRLAR